MHIMSYLGISIPEDSVLPLLFLGFVVFIPSCVVLGKTSEKDAKMVFGIIPWENPITIWKIAMRLSPKWMIVLPVSIMIYGFLYLYVLNPKVTAVRYEYNNSGKNIYVNGENIRKYEGKELNQVKLDIMKVWTLFAMIACASSMPVLYTKMIEKTGKQPR